MGPDPRRFTQGSGTINQGQLDRGYVMFARHDSQSLSLNPLIAHGHLNVFGLVIISGNKRNNVTVVYTPWSNLRKSGAMVAGEVSFHDTRLVKKVFVPARENAIINRLNKTRVEKFPDLREMRDEELQRKRKIKRQETSAGREQEKERLRELAEVKRARRDADALVQKQLEEERKKLEEQLENGGEAAEEEEFW